LDNGVDVYATERNQQILAAARTDGRVNVATLAADLNVTPETIRRDLTSLERHGLIRRVHGGAILVERLGFEPGLADREGVLAAEKDRTHALPVAMVLAGRPNITLHLVGGTVRGLTLAAVGQWALRTLADIHPDVAFVGTNGLTVEQGLTTADVGEAAVKRALIAGARRTVVLADHTKIGRVEFVLVAPVSAVDTLITDSGLDEELADEVEAAGPRVVRA